MQQRRSSLTSLARQLALVRLLAACIVPGYAGVLAAVWLWTHALDAPLLTHIDRVVLQASAPYHRSCAAAAGAIALAFGFGGAAVIAAGAGLAWLRRSTTPLLLLASAWLGPWLILGAARLLTGPMIAAPGARRTASATPPTFSVAALNLTVLGLVAAYLLQLPHKHHRRRTILGCGVVLAALTLTAVRVVAGADELSSTVGALLLGGAWAAMVVLAHRVHVIRRPEAPFV